MKRDIVQGQWFQPDIYQKTNLQISTLKGRLPEAAVVSLASEVIRRVSARVRELQIEAEAPSPLQIEQLARALVSDDEKAGAHLVLDATTAGMGMDVVYLSYLAGAARLLGEWWDDNSISLVDVAIGTGRIYSIMRASNHLFTPKNTYERKSAVFASAPNETHTLGIRMAADLFRKDGWDIDLLIGKSHDELVEEIERSDPRLIGLSSAGRHSSAALARLIVALRISNPYAYIMVSGRIVQDAEDIVSLLGADGVAGDFETAQAILHGFWDGLVGAEQTA